MGWRNLTLLNSLLIAFVCAGCEDAMSDAWLPFDGNQAQEYWYTRTRSVEQQSNLHKSYGLGFSYDAVNGRECDMNEVRCQVINLDLLNKSNRVSYSYTTSTEARQWTSHSFSEYAHMTNLAGKVKADLRIYSVEYSKKSSVYETGLDTVICVNNDRKFVLKQGYVQTRGMKYVLKSNPNYLTESFRYGLEKLKHSNAENILVVDSFINIFGTHVITYTKIGGNLNLEVKTSKSLIKDYSSEKTITKQQLHLLLENITSTTTQEEQRFAKQVLENSSMELHVKGGNEELLGNLVTQTSYNSLLNAKEDIEGWISSLDSIDLNQPISKSSAELIEMDVTPIWEFIPDETIAERVQSRIVSTASVMQQLYGNRNWVNTRLNSNLKQVNTWFTPKSNPRCITENNPWVYNIIASNRIVATVCREWVPNISQDEAVTVVYPVYNNKIESTLGLCQYGDSVYHVKWLYDRFEIEPDSIMSVNEGTMYLTCGSLSTQPSGDVEKNYAIGNAMVAYEWPGSIEVGNGNVVNTGWLSTRKFLGDFYLENKNQYSNLPNWSFVNKNEPSAFYESIIQSGFPYKMCGIEGDLNNRMVRDKDYTYYLNTNEAWYEKLR